MQVCSYSKVRWIDETVTCFRYGWGCSYKLLSSKRQAVRTAVIPEVGSGHHSTTACEEGILKSDIIIIIRGFGCMT